HEDDTEIVISRKDFRKASQVVLQEVAKSAREKRAEARNKRPEKAQATTHASQNSTLSQSQPSTSGAQDGPPITIKRTRGRPRKNRATEFSSQETISTLDDSQDSQDSQDSDDEIFLDAPMAPQNSPDNDLSNVQNPLDTPPDSAIPESQPSETLNAPRAGASAQRPTSLPTRTRSERVLAKLRTKPATHWKKQLETKFLNYVSDSDQEPIARFFEMVPDEKSDDEGNPSWKT
ncbi:unnamed protein product, partial [Allacma fusca]